MEFMIEKFNSILKVLDRRGQSVCFNDRHSSCFIITYKGRIRFTFADKCIFADPDHGVFIPKGACYKNECLDDAESILINFDTVNGGLEACELNTLDEKSATALYIKLQRHAQENSPWDKLYIFGELYMLAHRMFKNEKEKPAKQRLADDAYSYLQNHFSDPKLQVAHAAKHCHISPVYLRRLFAEMYGKTPFEVLTDIRMDRACTLILENRPVKEIAFSVGYSDIYQFSRAYKRYFGHSPTHVR